MSDRYQLIALNNQQLLAELRSLAHRERELLSDLLAHLAELDRRRLYLELGYPSLFAYCTESLGFCKSAAGRRITAARVCRAYPQAFVQVASGELRLSVLSVLNQYLTPSNAAELLEACRHQTFEQVEVMLATRFPRPDAPESIRRLPAPAQRSSKFAPAPASPARVCAPDIGSDCSPPAGVPPAGVPPASVPPVDEHHFASKSEQPARGEAVGELSLGQLTGQAVISGSGGSFLRERRSLA